MTTALTRTIPRGLGGALAVLAGGAVAAGCGGSGESTPHPAAAGHRRAAAAAVPLRPVSFTHDDPIGDPPAAQLLPVLERAAAAHLPAEQYGCVVAPPGDGARLRVLVRSSRVVPEARSIIRQLGGSRYATVRVQPHVRLLRDSQTLIAELRRQAARYGGAATVMEGTIVDQTTCGPVVLRDPPRLAALHAWVQRAAARHPDAIEVRPASTVRPMRIYPDTLGLGRPTGS